MEQFIKVNFFNDRLNIAMVDIKQVYLLLPRITALLPEVYRGKLAYRAKGSAKRISYEQIKNGLIKRTGWIAVEVPDWLTF